jgi:predicted HD superfamily hydrolase involved in NAD metabolism
MDRDFGPGFWEPKALEVFFEERLDNLCRQKRATHSRAVAALAERLCLRFGIPAEKGKCVGLAHDLLKDRPLEEQWAWARRAADANLPAVALRTLAAIEGEPAFSDKIIHGPAAAAWLSLEGVVQDPEFLEAVALHSSAAVDMSPFSKILYVADKLESGRSHIGDDDLRALEQDDLDSLMYRALSSTIGHLTATGHAIAQSSLDLYNILTARATAR